ncbi:MAG: N-acetyl sugar amidotransferase [Bacteroidota bacterium]
MIQASTNIPRTYKGSRPYQVCTRCVMDTSDPNIRFDENGVCNHCHEYAEKEARLVFKGEAGQKRLEETIADIKARGKGKEYDCILGLSGGVDSSYVALKAKEYGLRPLVVHYDNGWNSELAVSNIKNIVANLGFDLYTLVVNWEEFRDLQLAYLRASVIDIEVPTDHAIIATMFRLARKHKIAYTLPGGNVVTEGILPKAWIFRKTDHANLRAIHKAHGTTPLKTYPQYSFLEFLKSYHLHRVRPFAILNCLPYHKDEAKAELAEKLNWRDYGGKHYESVFTKFYQA